MNGLTLNRSAIVTGGRVLRRLNRVSTAFHRYARLVGKSLMRLRARPEALLQQGGGWVPADTVRLFWFVQTYHDLPRLRTTLAELRHVYPESEVMVMSDGDPDPEIAPACRHHAASFVLGERLYGIEQGGLLVRRILQAFLDSTADVLVKIDPDTTVRRRFTVMPSPLAHSIYGTVQHAGFGTNVIPSVQGGCIIVPRAAAACIECSSLLESERLKPPALEWAVSVSSRARVRAGLTSSDQTLGWACRELAIECREHPEVLSRYRPNSSLVEALVDRRMAVSHPRFERTQLADPAFYFSGVQAAIREAFGSSSDDGVDARHAL
jgi:hypothetical protein